MLLISYCCWCKSQRNVIEKNRKRQEAFRVSRVRESNAVISYRSACCPVTAVPDVERLVERLQHGLQYDGHAGARLQEDQLLPDDPLRGDTATGLREGVWGPESHLVSVHTHALRVWGLRALHVAGGARGRREERDAFPRAFAFALGGVHSPREGPSGKSRILARDRSWNPEAPGRSVQRTYPRGVDHEGGFRSRIARVVEKLLEKHLCTTLDR